MSNKTADTGRHCPDSRRRLLAGGLLVLLALLPACAAGEVSKLAGETVERQTQSRDAEEAGTGNREETGSENAGTISGGGTEDVFFSEPSEAPEDIGAAERKPLEVRGYDRENLTKRWVYTYDGQGNVASKETYDEFGEDAGRLEYRSEYTYDDQGFLISEKYCRYDGESSAATVSQWDYIYIYDEQGRVEERQEYQEQKLLGWKRYTYDDWGNVAAETNYLEDGSIADQIDYTYTYDEQGNVLRERARSWGGGVNSDYQYTYDGQGNLLTEERDIGELLLWNRKEYAYDEQGNLLTVYFYNQDGVCDGRYEYVY